MMSIFMALALKQQLRHEDVGIYVFQLPNSISPKMARKRGNIIFTCQIVRQVSFL